jgi:Tfp pilus assembly protein PilV
MKISIRLTTLAAFSLVEASVGMAIFGIGFVALHGGLTSSCGTVQAARDNLQATQIMSEKLDTIRLYGWDKITNSGYIPASFTKVYTAKGEWTSNGTNENVPSGIIYTGTLSIQPAGITETYSNDLRRVSVSLAWKTGMRQRTAKMSTFVSRFGLQQYVY